MRCSLVFAVSGALLVLAVAACGDGGANAPTASPSPAATSASPSGRPASGTARPDPATLLQPGYVLDRALEVSLDGSEAGQIVVFSHTVYAVLSTGNPSSAAVPATGRCLSVPAQETDAAACLFQAEVFAVDAASGWARIFVTPDYAQRLAESDKDVCGHRCGVQELGEPATFALGDGREGVVLAVGYCTGIGSGCGTYHEVLSMQEGEIRVVYTAWKAAVEVAPGSATFNGPAFFRHDAGCCPSGRRIETLALDPGTHELAVIESELVLCAEGALVLEPFRPESIAVACGPDAPVPGSIYETTAETVVEPSGVGGLQGLREGAHVRIGYSTECEGATYNCVLIAAKITVIQP